ncbi:hypothetical protein [Elizabethkingia miricola]|uniref:hypothetical protein n=1 Tax=Elizabethkingia miricola TaxID=172045 RepID=UPI003892BFAA
MKNNNLPIDELKKHGIIGDDNTFSKKLAPDDIERFLQGYTIVADNDTRRATFQLVENNTRLNVIFLERDKSLPQILTGTIDRIEYSDIKEVSNKLPTELPVLRKKAFLLDKETGKVIEFDLIKNATELTAIIADEKDAHELGRYKNELLKLKSFMQNKLEAELPPEYAKEISRDLNIVSKEISTVDGIYQKEGYSQKQGKSDVQLNVNDPDLYQDANRMKEEEEREDRRGPRR